MSFDILEKYGGRMLGGLAVTIELVAISIILGALLAIPITLARLSRNGWLRGISYGYVYFFRGTPLLAQTYLLYYGSGQFRHFFTDIGLWWFFREAFYCCLLTFTLNTAAYQAEIYRGAIRAIPHDEIDAGKALGFNGWQIFRLILLPQALQIAIRPLGNEIVLMIKGSAVAAIVTVFDLMGVTRLAYSRTFDLSVYFYAAILYLALVETLRRVVNAIEFRLTRHMRTPLAPEPSSAVLART
jgi:polar amino acid transport system permease protein